MNAYTRYYVRPPFDQRRAATIRAVNLIIDAELVPYLRSITKIAAQEAGNNPRKYIQAVEREIAARKQGR